MENKLLFFVVCFVVSIIFLAVLFLAIYVWDQLDNWLERVAPNWIAIAVNVVLLALAIATWIYFGAGD